MTASTVKFLGLYVANGGQLIGEPLLGGENDDIFPFQVMSSDNMPLTAVRQGIQPPPKGKEMERLERGSPTSVLNLSELCPTPYLYFGQASIVMPGTRIDFLDDNFDGGGCHWGDVF